MILVDYVPGAYQRQADVLSRSATIGDSLFTLVISKSTPSATES